MAEAADHLPEDAAALKAALIETRARLSGAEALIAHLQLTIEKMKRAMFGPRSERSQRLIDQLELQLEELAAAAGEDEAKAEAARVHVQGFTRRQGTRRNFPADLPRRRIVHPAPTSCRCCGGSKLSKIGEDVTETLDVIPRQWFVTEHVREKFSCRSCEAITQPPAPFHAIARGFAGPSLLAMMLVEKYANHQPLNRQSEQYAREGIELSVSTMADHARRHRIEGAQPDTDDDLANRFRGGSEVRRHLRAGTLDQWPVARSARSHAPQRRRATGERSRRLDETRAGQALASQRGRQGF